MKSRQTAAAGSRWECQASDGVNNRAHPDIAGPVHRACVRGNFCRTGYTICSH